MKELWDDAKKKFLGVTVAVCVGFCMGNIYTWDAIISDRKVSHDIHICMLSYNGFVR